MDMPIEFSSEIGEIAGALATAQGKMKNAVKDRTNPHFKNTYATLASVRDAVTPALSENGLSVVQLNEPHEERSLVVVVTILMHKSGQWIRSRIAMPATKADAQGIGSALTYARRYALSGILNISSEDDDDGEEAVAAPPQREAKQKKLDQNSNPNKEIVDRFVKQIKEVANLDALALVGVAVREAKLSDNDQAIVRKAYIDRTVELGA